MSEPFIGEIRVVPYVNAGLRGWAVCDGRLLSIAEYQALFSLLGTTYGGDGRVTFALPDLRGRAPMGAGQGPGLSRRQVGEQLGAETVALTQNELPAHRHGLAGTVAPASRVEANGNRFAEPEDDAYAAPAGVAMAPSGLAGGGLGHENQPPSLALHFIIAVAGIFPARN